jgi:hypothetical protein
VVEYILLEDSNQAGVRGKTAVDPHTHVRASAPTHEPYLSTSTSPFNSTFLPLSLSGACLQITIPLLLLASLTMAAHGNNPLVEPASPESSTRVHVYPLLQIAQNDHATRSTIREHGPIVGAILGSSSGQVVSMKIAFECGSKNMSLVNGVPLLDGSWFENMLKLCQQRSRIT